MIPDRLALSRLNSLAPAEFVGVCGPFFEHSPWVAARTCAGRPFASLADLHAALVESMMSGSMEEQLALIRAHPDLVGKMAQPGALTSESAREQAAAGLDRLEPHEVELFQAYNAEYRRRFGFPFILCARENRKNDILMSFPPRLRASRGEELATALAEIAKIARLRMMDRVRDD